MPPPNAGTASNTRISRDDTRRALWNHIEIPNDEIPRSLAGKARENFINQVKDLYINALYDNAKPEHTEAVVHRANQGRYKIALSLHGTVNHLWPQKKPYDPKGEHTYAGLGDVETVYNGLDLIDDAGKLRNTGGALSLSPYAASAIVHESMHTLDNGHPNGRFHYTSAPQYNEARTADRFHADLMDKLHKAMEKEGGTTLSARALQQLEEEYKILRKDYLNRMHDPKNDQVSFRANQNDLPSAHTTMRDYFTKLTGKDYPHIQDLKARAVGSGVGLDPTNAYIATLKHGYKIAGGMPDEFIERFGYDVRVSRATVTEIDSYPRDMRVIESIARQSDLRIESGKGVLPASGRNPIAELHTPNLDRHMEAEVYRDMRKQNEAARAAKAAAAHTPPVTTESITKKVDHYQGSTGEQKSLVLTGPDKKIEALKKDFAAKGSKEGDHWRSRKDGSLLIMGTEAQGLIAHIESTTEAVPHHPSVARAPAPKLPSGDTPHTHAQSSSLHSPHTKGSKLGRLGGGAFAGAMHFMNFANIGSNIALYIQSKEEGKSWNASLALSNVVADGVGVVDDIARMAKDTAGVVKSIVPKVAEAVKGTVGKALATGAGYMDDAAKLAVKVVPILKSVAPLVKNMVVGLSRIAPGLGIALETSLEDQEKGTRALGSTVGTVGGMGVGAGIASGVAALTGTAVGTVVVAPAAVAMAVGYAATEYTSIAIEYKKMDQEFKASLDEKLPNGEKNPNYLKHLTSMKYRLADSPHLKDAKKDAKGEIDLSDPENVKKMRKAIEEAREKAIGEMNKNDSVVPRFMRWGDSVGQYNNAKSDVAIYDAALKELETHETRLAAHQKAQQERKTRMAQAQAKQQPQGVPPQQGTHVVQGPVAPVSTPTGQDRTVSRSAAV